MKAGAMSKLMIEIVAMQFVTTIAVAFIAYRVGQIEIGYNGQIEVQGEISITGTGRNAQMRHAIPVQVMNTVDVTVHQ